MTEQQIEAKRREILKRVRDDEVTRMGEHSIAGFDHVMLRDRLKGSVALQKLYERVFFDDYDIA